MGMHIDINSPILVACLFLTDSQDSLLGPIIFFYRSIVVVVLVRPLNIQDDSWAHSDRADRDE